MKAFVLDRDGKQRALRLVSGPPDTAFAKGRGAPWFVKLAIRPVIDRVFPFESTNEAMVYVETGRARGKVVVKLK